MTEQSYESEDLLQTLIATYPSVLAGDQGESGNPRRLLLIRREMGVPAELDGNDRWSLDHLFLDQDAIPTLVEVKRSSDTRIRREVVGQLLDYAANAIVYWPVEAFRSHFEAQCEKNGVDPGESLRQFLGPDADPDEFWLRAKTNLQAGRIRMVFVADVIPPELRRIVEFLNEQMDPAEVLAVEIKQYVGQGMKTLVPRVIGQTAEAEKKKGTPRGERRWDEESFFAEYTRLHTSEILGAAHALYDTLKGRATRMEWGTGKVIGNALPTFDDKRGRQLRFNIDTNGAVGTNFLSIRALPFSDEAKRKELVTRLKEVRGMAIDDRLTSPVFFLRPIVERQGFDKLLEVVGWAIRQIEESRAAVT